MASKFIQWAAAAGPGNDNSKTTDAGLLFLRLALGFMMAFGHGWGKLTGFGERASKFADPFGLGPEITLALAVFAEFFCSLALAVGLLTRAVVIPLIITMLTAAFIIHSDDPWNRKEFALLYFVPFVTLMLSGAGRYSLDAMLFGRKPEAPKA